LASLVVWPFRPVAELFFFVEKIEPLSGSECVGLFSSVRFYEIQTCKQVQSVLMATALASQIQQDPDHVETRDSTQG
jgi:hypothetical protein